MIVRPIELSGTRKKYLEGTVTEDTIAIAHDNDLKVIEGVVSPSLKCWNLYSKSTGNARA